MQKKQQCQELWLPLLFDLIQRKQVTDILKQSGRHEVNSHKKVFRPWGYYDSIDTGHSDERKRN